MKLLLFIIIVVWFCIASLSAQTSATIIKGVSTANVTSTSSASVTTATKKEGYAVMLLCYQFQFHQFASEDLEPFAPLVPNAPEELHSASALILPFLRWFQPHFLGEKYGAVLRCSWGYGSEDASEEGIGDAEISQSSWSLSYIVMWNNGKENGDVHPIGRIVTLGLSYTSFDYRFSPSSSSPFDPINLNAFQLQLRPSFGLVLPFIPPFAVEIGANIPLYTSNWSGNTVEISALAPLRQTNYIYASITLIFPSIPIPVVF